MKTIILNIFLILCFQVSAQYASVFGTNSTGWQGVGYDLGVYNDSIVTNSEIDFNGITYKHLFMYINTDFYTEAPTESYAREDTSTGKVWWKRFENSTEVLVTDMTLEVGDVFPVLPTTWNGGNTSLTVESVYYQNGLKHIVFDYTLFGTVKFMFIEGLGTNIGLTYNRYSSSNSDLFLLCSYKDDISYFVNNNHSELANQCKYDFNVSVADISLSDSIKILPNYITDFFTVKSKIEINKIEIYNLSGKLIKTFPKQDKYSISVTSGGMYLIKIYTNTGSIVKKIIILGKQLTD